MAWVGTAGTTYHVAVGGFRGDQGRFSLELSRIGGNGSFRSVTPGCGAASLIATGSPNLGGNVRYEMRGASGVPYLVFGSRTLGVPLCAESPCLVGASFDLILRTERVDAAIPCDPNLVGAQVYCQGLDFGATGGCDFGARIELSEAVLTTIG